MCIVLLTTAHPEYSLVLIDNRDEYVLRPTSRPHWWTHPVTGDWVVSSRDLQRAEKGTWLGISRSGLLAVLTNYREQPAPGAEHGATSVKSRGRMVTAWLGGLPVNGVKDGVAKLVEDGGVKGVGGFSMLCGKLRNNGEGIAVVSNRADGVNDVPLIGIQREESWGLSNTVYDLENEWPKVKLGKRLLQEAVQDAASKQMTQDQLMAALFDVLDTDSMPEGLAEMEIPEVMASMRRSIFIPPVGDAAQQAAMRAAAQKGRSSLANGEQKSVEEIFLEQQPDATAEARNQAMLFEEGLYGTQRQTVLLVDLEGNVTLKERALWDANGNPIPKGEGDVTFEFRIEDWEA